MTEPADSTPPEVTLAEIAEATGMHVNSVRADMVRGYFTGRMVGRTYVVPAQEAAEYISHREQLAAAQAALDGLMVTIQARKDKRDAQRRK